MARALRGVNLGGWLVLERWMTPSLFEGVDAVDELTFCRTADKGRLKRLEQHRRQYITEADFRWLAAHGIEAVRIPVGYWLFGDAVPYAGTVEYLDKAFQWAEACRLKVLISLHGAPGSQNGQDHSGCSGPVAWHHEPANIERTLAVIGRLAGRYRHSDALLGISLLNEPDRTIPKRILKRFYKQAYHEVRRRTDDYTWVVFSDGFQPWRWSWVLHRLRYRRAFIDTHQYQIFSQADKRQSAARHLQRTLSSVPWLLRFMSWHHPVIVGEWSAALDPQSLHGLDEAGRQQQLRAYCRAQQLAYDQTAAWFFWNYKTEGTEVAHMPEWSYRACHAKGWFD